MTITGDEYARLHNRVEELERKMEELERKVRNLEDIEIRFLTVEGQVGEMYEEFRKSKPRKGKPTGQGRK
jgi:predicted  nucleic acid-binding Zn-ribbon protein